MRLLTNLRKGLALGTTLLMTACMLSPSSAFADPVDIKSDNFTQYGWNDTPMTVSDDGYLEATSPAWSMALYNEPVADHFSASIDMRAVGKELNDGLAIHMSGYENYNTSGIDASNGYVLYVLTDKGLDPNKVVLRMGKSAGAFKGYMVPEGQTNDWVEVFDLIKDAPDTFEITLRVEVKNGIVKAQVSRKDDPSITSPVITYDLSKPSSWETEENKVSVQASNRIGINSHLGKTGKRFTNFQLTNDPAGVDSLFNHTYFKDNADAKSIACVNDKFYNDGIGYNRIQFAQDVPDNFHMQADMTLSDTGNIRSGLMFRTNNMTAGVDSFSGYFCLLESFGNGRMDLILYKNGTRNSADDYSWLGEIGRVVSEGDSSWLNSMTDQGANAKIRMVIEVRDDEMTAQVYSVDQPTVRMPVLKLNLRGAGSIDDKKVEYFPSGKAALVMTNVKTVVENLQIAALEEEPTESEPGDEPDESEETGESSNETANTPGPLNALTSYDLYTSASNGTTFLQEGSAFTAAAPGAKKAIVRHMEVDNFTASITAKIDGNGNVCVGIPFRLQYVNNGQDDLEGYTCTLERIYNATNEARIDFVVHKYGKKPGDDSYHWLGEVARFVDEGEAAVLFGKGKAAGVELVFTVDVVGEDIRAFVSLKDNPKKISGALNESLKKQVAGDTNALYYTKGSIGILAGDIGETQINNVISDVQIKSTAALPNGTYNTDKDFYFYTEKGNNLANVNGLFTADGKGVKKALLRNANLRDQTISVELFKDASGSLQGGLLLRSSEMRQWGGAFKGYGIFVESTPSAPDRIDIAVYKYGKTTEGNNWLGYLKANELAGDRFVSEGDGSLAKGATNGWLLSATVKGKTLTVNLKKQGTSQVSQTLTYDLSAQTLQKDLDVYTEYHAAGMSGVIMDKGAFKNVKLSEGGNTAVITPPTGVAFPLAAGVVAIAAAGCLVVTGRRKKRKCPNA